MAPARWHRLDAVAPDPLAIDALDEAEVLVIDDVTAADDAALGWCRRAPCVVIGLTASVEAAPRSLDVVVHDVALADTLIDRVLARPHASRTLIDVLRVASRLPSAEALMVESLAYSMLLAGPEFASWLETRPPSPPKRFDGPAVRVARRGGVLDITLARPENRNAMSAEMRDALFEALTFAEVDDTISQILLGADGPSFSSGGDLNEFGRASDVVRAHQIRTLRSVGMVMGRLWPRVAAMVQGPCVGAGIELAAFCDRVVARPGATFQLPEVGMGLIPGAGGTVSISRRIGPQRTALMALASEVIDAEEALAIGLVDAIAT